MVGNHLSKSFHNRTLTVLIFAVFLPALIIIGRLFYLQIIKGDYYAKLVLAKSYVEVPTQPERGIIYFKDDINKGITPVAINKVYYTLYLDPTLLVEGNENDLTSKIKLYFPTIEETKIKGCFSKLNSQYCPLLSKIDDYDSVNKLKAEKIKSINFDNEKVRYYPLNELASQVIGFLQENNTTTKLEGVYGLEKYYNNILTGVSGFFKGTKSGLNAIIRSIPNDEQVVVAGSSLIVSIDKNVQFKTEQELKNMVEEKEAESGSAIIMESNTGRIVAMANYPSFNPNEYFKIKDYNLFRNNTVENRYELGSVMKVLTMSAGLDSGKIKEASTYKDDHRATLNNKTIGNYGNHFYGLVDMKEIMSKSINMGAVYIEQQIGGSLLRDYFKNFGLDSKTGIDLPNEVSGDLKNIDRREAREIDFATASYGQGIATTPIEMVRAMSAITNGGKMVNPYILESTKNSDGSLQSAHGDIEDAVSIISPETAEKIKSMMVYTVETGYGQRAKVDGYKSGGKTGTAMMFIDGEYSDTDNIHSFIGFFPVETPKYIIYTVLKKPQIGLSAESTAAVLWHNLAAYLVSYYNIPPDDISS